MPRGIFILRGSGWMPLKRPAPGSHPSYSTGRPSPRQDRISQRRRRLRNRYFSAGYDLSRVCSAASRRREYRPRVMRSVLPSLSQPQISTLGLFTICLYIFFLLPVQKVSFPCHSMTKPRGRTRGWSPLRRQVVDPTLFKKSRTSFIVNTLLFHEVVFADTLRYNFIIE